MTSSSLVLVAAVLVVTQCSCSAGSWSASSMMSRLPVGGFQRPDCRLSIPAAAAVLVSA